MEPPVSFFTWLIAIECISSASHKFNVWLYYFTKLEISVTGPRQAFPLPCRLRSQLDTLEYVVVNNGFIN